MIEENGTLKKLDPAIENVTESECIKHDVTTADSNQSQNPDIKLVPRDLMF